MQTATSSSRSGKRLVVLFVVLAVLLAGGLLAWHFHLFERVRFSFNTWQSEVQWRDKSLWLPDYRVVIEAQPVAGIKKNLSALTWNDDTGTLFSVTNNPPAIIELSRNGELLRRIPVTGISDPEAIEYIGDDRYIIADERMQKLIKIRLSAGDSQIDSNTMQQLTLGIGPSGGNKGIEGLAWDRRSKRLFAAKERNPIRIFEISGFPQDTDENLSIQIDDIAGRNSGLFLRDVSSLDFSVHHGHLLILSDESKLILETDTAGQPISSLSLRAGAHGLKKSIPQAEGMATDDEETLYLVSEPNLFYVFKKPN